MSIIFPNHSQLLGRYNRLRKSESNTAVASSTPPRTAYQHFSGRFFLYYNDHSQGFWAVGETINAGAYVPIPIQTRESVDCSYLYLQRSLCHHVPLHVPLLYRTLDSEISCGLCPKTTPDVVRLENQGDAECPYRMKSLWRFADGDLNALVYDISMQVAT